MCGILPTNDIGMLEMYSNLKWDLGTSLVLSEPQLSRPVPDTHGKRSHSHQVNL